MISETVTALIAAAATPFLGATGCIIWEKAWMGSPFALNVFKTCVSGVMFVIVALLIRLPTAHIYRAVDVGMLSVSACLAIVMGDNLWLVALKLIGVRRVIIVDTLKPFVGSLLGAIFLDQPLYASVLVGIILSSTGLFLASIDRKPPLPPPESDSDDALRAGDEAVAAAAAQGSIPVVSTSITGGGIAAGSSSLAGSVASAFRGVAGPSGSMSGARSMSRSRYSIDILDALQSERDIGKMSCINVHDVVGTLERRKAEGGARAGGKKKKKRVQKHQQGTRGGGSVEMRGVKSAAADTGAGAGAGTGRGEEGSDLSDTISSSDTSSSNSSSDDDVDDDDGAAAEDDDDEVVVDVSIHGPTPGAKASTGASVSGRGVGSGAAVSAAATAVALDMEAGTSAPRDLQHGNNTATTTTPGVKPRKLKPSDPGAHENLPVSVLLKGYTYAITNVLLDSMASIILINHGRRMNPYEICGIRKIAAGVMLLFISLVAGWHHYFKRHSLRDWIRKQRLRWTRGSRSGGSSGKRLHVNSEHAASHAHFRSSGGHHSGSSSQSTASIRNTLGFVGVSQVEEEDVDKYRQHRGHGGNVAGSGWGGDGGDEEDVESTERYTRNAMHSGAGLNGNGTNIGATNGGDSSSVVSEDILPPHQVQEGLSHRGGGHQMEAHRHHRSHSRQRSASAATEYNITKRWYQLPMMPGENWLMMWLGTCFVSFLSPILMTYALFKLNVGLVMTLAALGPIYSIPLLYVFKGEKTTLRACLGACLAFTGIVIMVYGQV